MEEKDRETLRRNRTFLVKNLDDVNSIMDLLYEKGTFTSLQKERILYKPGGPAEIKRELLDSLARSGPKAFDQFYETLVELEMGHVADRLKPEEAEERQKMEEKKLQERRPVTVVAQQPSTVVYQWEMQPVMEQQQQQEPLDDDLPLAWPDENYDPRVVNVTNVTNQEMMEMCNKSLHPRYTVYSMRKRPRGTLLIINNTNFEQAQKSGHPSVENRPGSEVDAASLRCLFEKFHFNTVVENDKTRDEIMTILKRERDSKSVDRDECFICFILSHGKQAGVMGTDGEIASIEKITEMFDNENCAALAGKPKLFFVQACRGVKADFGAVAATPGTARSEGEEIYLQRGVLQKFEDMNIRPISETAADADIEVKVPKGADLFLAFSTTPEHLSFRNTSRGTWFVQAITYIFQRYAHVEDINGMMTKVNLLVSRGQNGGGKKQASQYTSTFRKRFYFFPGLVENGGGGIQQHNQMQPTGD